MKRGRLLFVLAIVLLVLGYLPLHYFLPGISSMSGSYDLGPGGVNGPSLFLPYGGIVILDVAISGANRDVYFYITDGSGKRVFDAGRIYHGYRLEWTSPSFGTYRFNFDNTMSWTSHKYVSYTTQTYPYRIILLILGVVLLLAAVWQILREEHAIARVRKMLFKKPEPTTVACEYCGAEYGKNLDKCPNCSARKRMRPRTED